MSTKTKKSEETNEKITAVQETEAAPEKGADTEAEKAAGREEKLKAFLGKLPDPCVYCGPSVRGVARQYTVFTGGIPDVLKDFILQHPAARGLLVPTERFASVRKSLETPGTGLFILFNKVRAEL